jgi:hypothetical protein
MLKLNKLDDLRRMYALFGRVTDGHALMRDVMSTHLKASGTAIITYLSLPNRCYLLSHVADRASFVVVAMPNSKAPKIRLSIRCWRCETSTTICSPTRFATTNSFNKPSIAYVVVFSLCRLTTKLITHSITITTTHRRLNILSMHHQNLPNTSLSTSMKNCAKDSKYIYYYIAKNN